MGAHSATNRRLFLFLSTLSLLLSTPSLARLPRVLPFLDPVIRTAAPRAMEKLRKQGFWLVNIDLLEVERHPNEVCFTWEHRYTRRDGIDPPEILTTCIHADA